MFEIISIYNGTSTKVTSQQHLTNFLIVQSAIILYI